MPGGMQPAIGLLPWPPAAWSATLASNTAWYSGERGGFCGRPVGLVGSKLPDETRNQRPFHSGYLDSSCAPTFRADANIAAQRTIAPRNVLASGVENGRYFMVPSR